MPNLPGIIGELTKNFFNFADPYAIDKYWWCTFIPFAVAMLGTPVTKVIVGVTSTITGNDYTSKFNFGSRLPELKNCSDDLELIDNPDSSEIE